MSTKPSLCMRILQALAHQLWAALFFLFTLAVVFVAHHYWTDLVVHSQPLHGLYLKIIGLITN